MSAPPGVPPGGSGGWPPPPPGGVAPPPPQGYPQQNQQAGYPPPPPPGYPQQGGYPPPPAGYPPPGYSPQAQPGYPPPPPPGYPAHGSYPPAPGYPQAMAGQVTCYKCGSPNWSRVTMTWWGGWLGPAMFSHAKCNPCGATFNSKTGKSNDGAIAVYFIVVFAITIAIVFAINS